MISATGNTLAFPEKNRRNSIITRLLSPAPDFAFCHRAAERRLQAEAFISEQFRLRHAAEINEFFPHILGMLCFEKLSATAGLRPANHHELFLEQYLDQSIEQLLSSQQDNCILRSEIAEIGNLACSQRGASHLLFLIFSSVLHQAGYRWIVFTATRELRNSLNRLGFDFSYLAEASVEVLDKASQKKWGRYYTTQPQVIAGSLEDAMDIIRTRPLFRRIHRIYRHKINYLSKELGDLCDE
ncbi:MAG: hypothetical protein CMP91_00135 [Gammaproteobacteria bacterium]|nr:hypothetical protein [Gammaproteobacteria bacterium]|tara:strand:+ start:24752 stop:25474 length:723 start_codon:yes stop_codon:yes gene_type:complete